MDPILIVDDEKDNLQALNRLLRGEYEVTLSQSPFDAIKLIQQKPFNVIVSDQRMPEMTGVELLEKAKNLAPLSTRILLTGYTDIESIIGAINRGNIYRYIAKPWDPDDLKLTLRQANEAFKLRSEIEKKNLELSQALEELKVLDEAKGRFLSLVSHELNTPITILSSFTQLLNETPNLNDKLPPEIRKSIANIGGATERLTEIVNSILTYVKLAGTTAIKREECQGKALWETAFKAAQKASGKKIKLDLKVSSGSFQGDREKLNLAFQKIAHEIVERADAASEISVKSDTPGSFEILWKGKEITEDALGTFETGESILHHSKNLGLDLATARLIIDKHHGSLSVKTTKGENSLSTKL